MVIISLMKTVCLPLSPIYFENDGARQYPEGTALAA